MSLTTTGGVCAICGSDVGQVHRACEQMLGLGDEFRYFECGRCHSLQLVDPPAEWQRYYPADYYSLQEALPSSPQARGSMSLRRWLRERRDAAVVFGERGFWGSVASLRPSSRASMFSPLFAPTRVRSFDARILDIGCGAGALLKSLHRLGFRNLMGVDPHLERETCVPGLSIRKLPVDSPRIAGQFDLVMCHHSLEHMPDHSAVLRAIAGLLKPEGDCLIRMPVASCALWRDYGVDWLDLDAPRHLLLHSRRSFEMVATEAGLRVDCVMYDATASSYWGSELYRRGIPYYVRDEGRFQDPQEFFSPEELRGFRLRADMENRSGTSSTAAYYMRREPGAQRRQSA